MINQDVFAQAFDMLSKFEQKVKPSHILYKGFPIWLGIRQYIYMYIKKSLDSHIVLDSRNVFPTPQQIVSYIHLLFGKMKFINRSLVLNHKMMKGKYIIVSYENCRRGLVDGKSINIFIDPIRIADKDNEIVGVENVSPGYLINEKEMFYTFKPYDLFLIQAFSFVSEKFITGFLKRSINLDRLNLDKIVENLKDIGIKSELFYRLVYNFVIYFEFLTRYWTIVFRTMQPKLVAGTDWYSRANMLMFFVANKMGIPTVEITHGLINKYHYGYVFKNWEIDEKLRHSFPKYLIVFGKFFKSMLDKEGTLWQENEIFDLGYPWLDYFLNNIKVDKNKLKAKFNIEKNHKILTITAQDVVQASLKNKLLNLKIPNDWIVLVKIHPTEILSYKRAYHRLFNRPKIKFVTDKDIFYYELLKISDAHAGFCSTALWEAAAFGIPNYIVDHPTKQFVKEIEHLGLAKISTIQDIFNDNYVPNGEAINYVFSNLNGNSAQKVVDFFKRVEKMS